MKTAPRDETRILIWRDGDALPFIGQWGNPFAFLKVGRDAWIGHAYGLLDDRDVVGWLPLPARTLAL
jgi:hypothetical protein